MLRELTKPKTSRKNQKIWWACIKKPFNFFDFYAILQLQNDSLKYLLCSPIMSEGQVGFRQAVNFGLTLSDDQLLIGDLSTCTVIVLLNKPIAFLTFSLSSSPSWFLKLPKGDVTRDDSQRQLLAQHRVAMLEQCCNHSKQCCYSVLR